MDRRDILKGMIAAATATTLSACGKSDKPAPTPPSKDGMDTSTFYKPGEFLKPTEMAFLTVLSDTIIPETDTPGAIGAEVPATLQNLMSDWASDDIRKNWRAGLKGLMAHLDSKSGQEWRTLPPSKREEVLARFDAEIFGGQHSDLGAYKDMKSTIVTAYYMSEPGATEELIYEAVPGEWKGCVPFADIGRTWAT